MRLQRVARALALASAILATTAPADTTVERLIAAARPCSGLKTEVKVLLVRVPIGIDVTKDVRLERASATLEGDTLSLSARGGLTCETSGAAEVRGDASLDLAATARVDLRDCSTASVSLGDVSFGGKFAPALKAFWTNGLGTKLRREAVKLLREECQRLGSR